MLSKKSLLGYIVVYVIVNILVVLFITNCDYEII